MHSTYLFSELRRNTFAHVHNERIPLSLSLSLHPHTSGAEILTTAAACRERKFDRDRSPATFVPETLVSEVRYFRPIHAFR